MATNTASNFSADVGKFIQKKTLELTQRNIVLSQTADKIPLPKGYGTTYNAFRYERVPLPYTTLSEGVAPTGETMSITQVTGTVSQWGDLIRITDVAELTIYHPVFTKAVELVGYQVAETIERNTANAIMGGTQVNYVGAVGSRASLTSTSYLTPHEINRAVGTLVTLGARYFRDGAGADLKNKAASDAKGIDAVTAPHYVGVIHPLVEQDMRENSTVATAWQYSDIGKLYNNEIGQWGGIRFTRSNLLPYWTGVATVGNGTPSTSGGSLATGTYYLQVTASDNNTQYERLIYQVGSGTSVTGPTGSISITVPSTAGYTYNVYIGTTSSPTNLAASASGPTTGPLSGQAVQLAPGTTAVLTAVGTAQTPPAAPATGVTVYPTFILGKEAFAQIELDSLEMFYLKDADKSDPNNQTRVVSWKIFYGTMIMNNNFFMRIESASAFSATFG
ncbi:MAG: N4-gp56 family major capsid protein [Betaproteobacteria bacterium]|nr:N4-gp56 family major capsid protein [Betaproteobacteria bacterium]